MQPERAVKVCLVSAPGADQTSSRSFSEDAPLGILTLAAVLEQNDVSVHIVGPSYLYHLDFLKSQHLPSAANAGQSPDFVEVAARHLSALPFDVFGFSTVCSTFP